MTEYIRKKSMAGEVGMAAILTWVLCHRIYYRICAVVIVAWRCII